MPGDWRMHNEVKQISETYINEVYVISKRVEKVVLQQLVLQIPLNLHEEYSACSI